MNKNTKNTESSESSKSSKSKTESIDAGNGDCREYDVLIVGAGVIGTFVARHMSKKNLKVGVIEKEDDVCCGVSKAHTAIVHCGYSGKPGSLKAKITVKANENFHNVCEDLDVEFRRCGSIITAKADKGMEKLNEKMSRGIENGVKGLEMLNREETLKIEPNISDEVIASVYAPTTGVADPWEFCVAAMENAMDNGVELFLNTKVIGMEYIDRSDEKMIKVSTVNTVSTDREEYLTKYLINCAGLYSDEINNMTEDAFFKIAPRKGEYIILDKSAGDHINGFIFQAREEDAPKGVIVSPTIHGNLMVGPSTEDISDKTDTSNSIEGLEHIKKISALSVKDIPFEKTISYFAGIRPRPNWIMINEKGEVEGYEDKVKDFILTRGKKNPNLINVAGIKSPGFTCADELGKYVYEMVYEDYMKAERAENIELSDNKNFNPKRKKRNRIKSLEDSEINRLISEDPDYGEVICKCNLITKGEIIDVIRRNAGALTVDGVKRRTGASMGKCHGSHCKTEIQKIIDSEIAFMNNGKNESKNDIDNTSSNTDNTYDNKRGLLNKSTRSGNNELNNPETDKSEKEKYDVIIIGGGIAGVSVAVNLIEKGIKSLAIVERDSKLGGILNQCIHHGFGVKYLKKNMTGPEYSNYFVKKLIDLISENSVNINIMTETEALSIKQEKKDQSLSVRVMNRDGLKEIHADSVVMSTGCIERHIGQIFLTGNRVKGIYTAGEAQRIVNIDGNTVGKKAVIIGSGDIGLIMARRLMLEGTEVLAILERNDKISGLERNKAECVDAYGIPIEFSSNIKKVYGKKNVEGLEYEKDGEMFKIDCDCIITSVGLEPDTDLIEEFEFEDSESVFILGNSDYVHDLVDDIAVEAEQMSDNIIEYLKTGKRVELERGAAYEYGEIKDYDIVCTVCPESCRIKYKNEMIFGNRCPRGREYAISQRDNPSRYITTTIEIKDGSGRRASVKTLRPVKSEIIPETVKLIKELEVSDDSGIERLKLKNGTFVTILGTVNHN